MTQQQAYRIAISGLRFNLNNITKRLNVTTNPLKWIDGINVRLGLNINLQYNNGNYAISAPDLLDMLEYDIGDYDTTEQLHSTVCKISQRYLAVA